MDRVRPVRGVGPSGSASHLPPYSQQLEAQHCLIPVDDPPSDDDNGNLKSQTVKEVNLDVVMDVNCICLLAAFQLGFGK